MNKSGSYTSVVLGFTMKMSFIKDFTEENVMIYHESWQIQLLILSFLKITATLTFFVLLHSSWHFTKVNNQPPLATGLSWVPCVYNQLNQNSKSPNCILLIPGTVSPYRCMTFPACKHFYQVRSETCGYSVSHQKNIQHKPEIRCELFHLCNLSSIQKSFSCFADEWLALKCNSSQEIRLLIVSQYFSLIVIAVQWWF